MKHTTRFLYSFVIAFFMVIVFTCAAFGQQKKPTGTIDKAATDNVDWHARWIWLGNPPGYKNQYVYARREFDLKKESENAVLHISADTYYRLYINGEYVGHGPPRSEPAWISYDTYEVQKFLHRGTNTIAIEANSCIRDKGALICQIEIQQDTGSVPIKIFTNKSWRVKLAQAYDPTAKHGSKWEYGEIYDASKVPDGWQHAGFDDKGWEEPYCLDEQDAGFNRANQDMVFPAHTHTRPYYSLFPSDIPKMRNNIIYPKEIADKGEAIAFDYRDTDIGTLMAIEREKPLKTCTVENAESLLKQGSSPVIVMNELPSNDVEAYYHYWDQHGTYPTVKNAYIVLDFGRLVNGYFQLDVEGAAGSIIDIGYGQMMEDGRVLMRPYNPDIWGMANRYILKDGRQAWEGFHYRNFRYVRLTFRKLPGPVKIHGFTVKTSEYPAEPRGSFTCSDPLITELWQASKRTVDLCLQDSYMDGTFREKGIWTGDVSNALLGAFAAYGDIAATQRYFRIIAQSQFRTGHFPRELPHSAQFDEYSPDYLEHSMQFVLRICEYYWYGGNRQLLDDLYPALFKYLKFLEIYRNKDGLLENVPLLHWFDWAPIDLRGAPLVTNAMYYEMLQGVALIADEYGRPRDAARFREFAQPILPSIEKLMWNEKRCLYVDALVNGRQSDVVSEHANVMVLAHNIGNDSRLSQIVRQLENPPKDLIIATSSCSYFSVKGRFNMGESKQALDYIKKGFGRFVIPNAETTFWEEWSARSTVRGGFIAPWYRLVAMGSPAHLGYALSAEVLGVKPTKPGFTHFRVNPQAGDLDWAEGVLPAPTGDIKVRWEKKGKEYILKVEIPEGAEAEICLPLGEHYFINDVPFDQSTQIIKKSKSSKNMIVTVVGGRFEFRVAGAGKNQGSLLFQK